MMQYSKLDPDQCEFVGICSIDELPEGKRLFVEIDGERIVVFNIANAHFAIADICSHDDGPLGDGEIENGYEISCPRHGAHFDIRTGKALTYPAVIDIQSYPVRVVDQEIQVGVPS